MHIAGRAFVTAALASLALPVHAHELLREDGNRVAPAVADPATSPGDTAPSEAGSEYQGGGEIIVTANKREQSINSVGMSITALDGDSLVKRGVAAPTDLAKLVAGLTVQPSPFNTPVYTLRGIGFYETTLSAAPTVAVYTDEVALPFSATSRGAGLDAERVEVLKGPQGTLFGQNTTGGAINYVSAKPTNTFSAGADASFGRFSAYDVSGFVSGPLSDTLKGRVAIKTSQSGPWQRSFTRNDSLGRVDKWQGRVLLDWDPTDRIRFVLNLNGWLDRSDTQASQLVDDTCRTSNFGTCGSPAALAFAAYPRAPQNARAADWGAGIFGRPNRRDDRFYQASLRGDFELTDALTLTSITAYSDYKTNSVQDFDGSTLNSSDNNTTGHIHDISQELRISGTWPGVHAIVGANYDYAKTYDNLFYNISDSPSADPLWFVPGAPKASLTFNYSYQNIKTSALFANIEHEVAPGVTLIGGARYTDSRRSFRGCTNAYGSGTADWFNYLFGTTVQPGGCVTFTPNFPQIYNPELVDHLNEDNLSWNAGVNYKTGGGTLLYARVSKGYKAGSFPTASVVSYTGYIPVKQESVLAYEVGIKAPLFDRRAEVTLAGFYYDYHDKQLRGRKPDPLFGTLDGLVQIPKSWVKGVEASLLARPVDGLTLSVGTTYIETRITEYSGFDASGAPTNFAGQQFPYSPKVTVTADAEYKFGVGSGAQAYLGSSLTYNSKTSSALANQTTAFVTRDARFDIPAYALIDLRAGVEFNDGKVRVGAYVRNLTDKYYWTNVLDNLASIVRYAGMPRTYGVQVSWRY
ncbi:MAG: TonB-dependent receptor [Sphingomonadales bacterium]|nr:TonB-dependent receptor [Sphingomonadales bacterium]